MDNATHQLQCVSTNNASFPREKLQMLQYELGKIITSTLNVVVHLVRKKHLRPFIFCWKAFADWVCLLCFSHFISILCGFKSKQINLFICLNKLLSCLQYLKPYIFTTDLAEAEQVTTANLGCNVQLSLQPECLITFFLNWLFN